MNDLKKIDYLGLIAALMTLGYSPVDRVREGKTISFLFEASEDLEANCKDFYNSRLTGDLQTYYSTLRTVKTIIFKMLNDKP